MTEEEKPYFDKALAEQHGDLWLIPEEFKTAELCLAAVKQNGMALFLVPAKLKTRELCLAAASNMGASLMYIPPKVWDRDFCLAVLEISAVALAFVPEEYLTEEICRLAVEWHGEALGYVPEQLKTRELCQTAVIQNGEALAYVPKQFKKTWQLSFAVLRRATAWVGLRDGTEICYVATVDHAIDSRCRKVFEDLISCRNRIHWDPIDLENFLLTPGKLVSKRIIRTLPKLPETMAALFASEQFKNISNYSAIANSL
jgi:hypothetical protein